MNFRLPFLQAARAGNFGIFSQALLDHHVEALVREGLVVIDPPQEARDDKKVAAAIAAAVAAKQVAPSAGYAARKVEDVTLTSNGKKMLAKLEREAGIPDKA